MRNFAAPENVYVFLPVQRDRSGGHGVEEFLLLRETHHRMANTLTLLAAQLWNEFGSSKVPEVRPSLIRFEARIAAFGRLHRLLAIGASRRPMPVRAYIEELSHSLSEAMLTPLGIRCEASADEGILPSDTCERLGLIIAELVTNAAKHAFTGLDGGLVRIGVIRKPGRWLCTISDNGTGITAPQANSGTGILDDVAHMIGGTLMLRSGANGTSVAITFPS